MGNTSGTTRVALQVLGSQTVSNLNSARVVRVDGESGGEFVAVGRLIAGAYDYALLRGNNTDDSALIPDSNHWYLTNTWTPSEEPIRDPEEPAIDPDTPVLPVQQEEPASHDSVLRPELGTYLANKSAGNTLFTTRLHDRPAKVTILTP